jgi:hypothetical protein
MGPTHSVFGERVRHGFTFTLSAARAYCKSRMAAPTFLVDGSLDFSAGANSLKPTTVASQSNPGGLPRNALSWMNNASVRDSGISPRDAWIYKGRFHDPNGLFQGGILYEPIDGITPPYFLIAISGRILKVDPDFAGPAVDLSAASGLSHPATLDYFYFVQGEQFVVIQAGDLVTEPLFWDGAVLRRSVGILGYGPPPTSFSLVGTNYWNVPSVGNSITINLSAAYGGAVNDIVEIFTTASQAPTFGSAGPGSPSSVTIPPIDAGQFTVTAKTAVAPFTVTVKVNSTTTAGSRVGPGNITFNIITSASPVSEIPSAGPMDYFHGRFWYGQGLKFCAGDIVRGPSGTAPYDHTDSILKITENPLAIGGDGFAVPTSSGNIRAIKHTVSLDIANGQGDLLIATRKAIYKLDVPISRSAWIASDNNNQPKLTPVQLNNGAVGDRCMVNVNGDLYYMSLEPSIRSLIFATRFFGEPGNRSISNNEQRAFQFYDRAFLRFTSGIAFDNRLLMTGLPSQTAQGVVHKLITPLDFVPMSSFGEDMQPVWNGVLEGLDFMQLFTSGFNGLERAFAVVRLQDGSFSIWEITVAGRFDNNVTGEVRINWSAEFPAFTWQTEIKLKRLVAGELWVDRLFGEVVFKLEYRPDGETCWKTWHEWKACSARSSAEDCANPITYPVQPYGDGYKQTMILPKPPVTCEPFSLRPSDVAYQQQCRLTVKGYCRIRGFFLYAEPVEREMYKGVVC